jgi:hypothetical protein
VCQLYRPPLDDYRGGSGIVNVNGSPTCMPVRDAGDMSSTIVWPSGVWTFTRFIVVSTALTVACTIPCTSLPLMSADEWEDRLSVAGRRCMRCPNRVASELIGAQLHGRKAA